VEPVLRLHAGPGQVIAVLHYGAQRSDRLVDLDGQVGGGGCDANAVRVGVILRAMSGR
jgi:hypothetical protein